MHNGLTASIVTLKAREASGYDLYTLIAGSPRIRQSGQKSEEADHLESDVLRAGGCLSNESAIVLLLQARVGRLDAVCPAFVLNGPDEETRRLAFRTFTSKTCTRAPATYC